MRPRTNDQVAGFNRFLPAAAFVYFEEVQDISSESHQLRCFRVLQGRQFLVVLRDIQNLAHQLGEMPCAGIVSVQPLLW